MNLLSPVFCGCRHECHVAQMCAFRFALDCMGGSGEEREEAGSLPFGCAQGRNDNQKGNGKDNSNSRFPAGMTNQKGNSKGN
ncbi:structural constituent of cell wall, putative [Granulicella mallensis MP5ACTX8]|uniref:Structural constituent of cell wall, putative n=1 Tax=Granulicella mallensis (strain ATCC BAA-1857 / DSM 23137 / MP5ACTX8) TaxID=682795 RepID=G8NVB3_GRAMM|nr:structural constituent of cell wall, putative [Granulicella mallensis MP5ACTX8]